MPEDQRLGPQTTSVAPSLEKQREMDRWSSASLVVSKLGRLDNRLGLLYLASEGPQPFFQMKVEHI